MSFYQLIQEQILPTSLEAAWDFITSPENLKRITPPQMGFDITSEKIGGKIYPGMIITYKVKPFPVYTTQWVTEITHVKELSYFVDEQRIGPYRMWHHQHHIEAVQEGVRMTDIITYQPPFGFIGAIANKMLIRNSLQRIFDFRRKALEHQFNSPLTDTSGK